LTGGFRGRLVKIHGVRVRKVGIELNERIFGGGSEVGGRGGNGGIL